MSDTLVFDIETQNFFSDPEVGWNNFDRLKISVVGIYSYNRNIFFCFEESEIGKAAEIFHESNRIVGFSINRYDVPVLQSYFGRMNREPRPALWQKERIDLLAEIEMAAGQRISLSKLAGANLGLVKDRHGSEAPELYRAGKIAELKEYCLNDVKLTKDLYDLYRRQGYLLVPEKGSGKILKVVFRSLGVPTANLF